MSVSERGVMQSSPPSLSGQAEERPQPCPPSHLYPAGHELPGGTTWGTPWDPLWGTP